MPIDSISQSWSVLSGAADADARAPGDGRAGRASRAPRRPADPASDAAVRQVGIESRLHQGLRARRARERRAIHAWRDLGGDGVRRARRQRARVGALAHDQPGQSRARCRKAVSRSTRSSPMSSPPTSTRVAPHVGRGGWTWYTGSAGWMYRLIVESLLGLKREVDQLRFAPCLPVDWDSVSRSITDIAARPMNHDSSIRLR